MFVLGHVGIGRVLTRRWRSTLQAVPLLLGMLLPDVIDKPLYYSRIWESVSSTRTFGHTGLLLVLITAVAIRTHSRALIAVAAGVATHLFLDCVLDVIGGVEASSALAALVWPFSGGGFTRTYISSLAAHAEQLSAVPVVASELVGAMLLFYDRKTRSRE